MVLPVPETHVSCNPLRYALVTPVRDEEAYIGEMIESIVAQTVPPALWVIVDDGSLDRTPAIVRSYARSCPYLHRLQLHPRDKRQAGGEGALPLAIRQVPLDSFDFIARFDADLLFPPDYIERMLEKFQSSPRLGIAGGLLYIRRRKRLVPERQPECHVRGALKMYRRQCFVDIGGLSANIGWDTLDEVSAWVNGWETRNFEDVSAIHRRPTGQGLPAWRIFRQRGRAEYLTWSDPVFVLGKSVKIAFREVSLIKPVSYLYGFAASYAHNEQRIDNPAIPSARRAEQRGRMRHLLSLGLVRSKSPVSVSLTA